jgi:arginyl-tRNA--protein-N-Asp/Glu arginylyltransferase
LFVWDYSVPASKLGSRSLEHEIAWSKQAGYEFVYLGPGYERSSLYKADIQGFEWWDGVEWSRDADKYRRLCRRDSQINSVSDLYDV